MLEEKRVDTIEQLCLKIQELENKIDLIAQQLDGQLILYRDNICHKCKNEMELVEDYPNDAKVYQCVNPNCPNCREKVIVGYPSENSLDFYLVTHQA